MKSSEPLIYRHDSLVELGAKWLKQQGFGVVVTELRAFGCLEEADVFGFRSNCSALIEVKISRSDFKADAKKTHRKGVGIGTYRFYFSPPGIIAPHDIPSGWGLLHIDGNKIAPVVAPKGNYWPSYGCSIDGWTSFQHLSDMEQERNLLYSFSRRIKGG
jgi:hypothetical protein